MSPVELAKVFSEELDLTPEQLDAVNKRNAAEPDGSGVCHSHDFCDANQAMLDAIGEEFENSDEQNALINAAWSIAKRNGFCVSLIDSEERGESSRA